MVENHHIARRSITVTLRSRYALFSVQLPQHLKYVIGSQVPFEQELPRLRSIPRLKDNPPGLNKPEEPR